MDGFVLSVIINKTGHMEYNMILDRIVKFLSLLPFIALCVFILFAFWLAFNHSDNQTKCDEKSGTLIKTAEGWVCAEIKVLQ